MFSVWGLGIRGEGQQPTAQLLLSLPPVPAFVFRVSGFEFRDWGLGSSVQVAASVAKHTSRHTAPSSASVLFCLVLTSNQEQKARTKGQIKGLYGKAEQNSGRARTLISVLSRVRPHVRSQAAGLQESVSEVWPTTCRLSPACCLIPPPRVRPCEHRPLAAGTCLPPLPHVEREREREKRMPGSQDWSGTARRG